MRESNALSVPGRARAAVLLSALVMAVVVLFVAAGCAAIPTRGPVGKSDPVLPHSNNINVSFQQFAPVAGASPESIIRGFIESGTGISDDYQVARQYLTAGLAQSWAPDKRTLVYKNAFSVAPGADKGTYKVTFDVASTVDANGVLTPADTGTTETLDMSLAQVDGEWRIAKAPDGVVLSPSTFQALFSPVSLYFYDPSFTRGVPDVRWLAGRAPRTATAIVRAMLAGPAPYLKGAVVSAFPNGIALERDSVPVNNGIAKVGLTAQPLLATSVRQRQQMRAQLLLTLQKALSTVTDLQFLADEREVDMGGSSDVVAPMILDSAVPSTQVALSKNELVTFDGSKVSAISGLASIANLAPSAPAVSYSGNEFAFLAGGGGQVYKVSPGQVPAVAAVGTALTPPSFAPNGWLWTAAGDGSGTVMAINANPGAKETQPVVLTVPWLAGRHVTTLRVSRDGTRALVISDADGVTRVSITGIFTSGDMPKELTQPATLVDPGNPTVGVWVDDSSVAVMAPAVSAPVTIQILDLALDPVPLPAIAGALWLSAGAGVRNVHAQTSEGIFNNVGNRWEPSVKSLRQAAFAG